MTLLTDLIAPDGADSAPDVTVEDPQGAASSFSRIDVSGISADSRDIAPGFIFAALEGTHADGLRFLPSALENGAAAVLVRKGRDVPGTLPIPVLRANEPRKTLARLAARLYPGRPETIAAVTGTNGKTSVAVFLRQIWAGLGHAAASMGTLGVVTPHGPMPLAHTTPDPARLHQVLKALHDTGISHLALEASSHGLDQDRLEGVPVNAAGFTNLTRDHLDYHGSMDAYREAKLRLFTERLVPDGTGVINMASPDGAIFRDRTAALGRAVITVGTPDADLALLDTQPVADGLRLTFHVEGQPVAKTVPLFGLFQAENIAVAVGLAVALGADLRAVLDRLPQLEGAHGRMERVALGPGDAPIFVDYAHTPDALERVLIALKPHAAGRIHLVFGCGGDRDKGKRPLMGAVASRLGDRVFVTDDNPRTEDPAEVRAQIMAACPGAAEIGDRAEAITAAVAGLEKGDILVIAGKGHETGQIVGDTVLPFDDAQVVRAVMGLKAKENRNGGQRHG